MMRTTVMEMRVRRRIGTADIFSFWRGGVGGSEGARFWGSEMERRFAPILSFLGTAGPSLRSG